MAYFIGAGDTAQLDYIVRTLKEKLYIRDGVTTNDEVKIPSAEVVNYWVKGPAGNGTSNTPGSKQEFAARALTKKSVAVDTSEQLSGVIPGVNIATVSANTVNAYVVDGTIEAANRINRDYLTKLEAVAEAKTVTGSDMYAKILNLRATFIKENGTVGEDGLPASYIQPTAMFVSPKVMAELKRLNLIFYKDNDPMGSFLDMAIIEAPNLTNDIVMLHKVAMISGISFNAVKTFDASVLGYADGVAYIGEIAYVNKATELGTDTVCKSVMAVATL